MKSTLRTIAGIIALALFVCSARAAVIAYEPFNYSTGTFANNTASTGTGETGNWTCGASGTIVSGLTYTALPVANNALSSTGSRQFVSLSSSLTASGTKYISFIFKTSSGNPGANINGVYFPSGNASSLWFGFGLSPQTATTGFFGLGSVTTSGSSATTATSLATTGIGTYGNTYLVVLKIDFNTSGNNDTVTVYLNPTANASAPGVSSSGSTSSFDVGTISKFGLNVQGATTLTVDEVRFGDTYGDVVGYVATPATPTGVSAAAGNAQTVINWSASANATGYYVLRGTTSGTYPVTNIINSTGTGFTNTGLNNGTTYYYVVQATNAAGASASSTEVSATPIAPPSAPTGLTATPGVNTVGLAWDATAGATGYKVLRGTSSGVYNVTNNVTANTNFDVTVVGGTTYYYVIQATNTSGTSASSSEVSVTPTAAVPGQPTSLVATPANSSVALSWSAGAGSASYNVKRSTTSGSGYTTISATGAVTGTSYTDTTAVNGTVYYYVVSGTNSAGEGPDSSQATATMPPATPANLVATSGSNSVSLTWDTAALAVSYNVKRSTTSGSGYTTISTSGAVTSGAYTDSTAISGTTYYYVVSAVNTTGEGTNSTQSSATPTGAPQPPTGVTVTTNYTSLTLSWTAALGAPTSYNVKRATTSGAETTITNVAGTTFTDSSVTVGTTYFYKISALNGDGEGANSSEVAGKAPGLPSAYEPFNYTAGTLADGATVTGTGFTGTWSMGASATITTGLTKSGLTTTNNAMVSSSGRQIATFSSALSSGTIYISYLVKGSGNPGGNVCGVFLKGDQTTSMFAGFYSPFSGTDTGWGLGTVTTAGTGATATSTTIGSPVNIGNSTVHLMVMKIDFNTSGANDTVSLWIDPAVGTNSPGTSANVTSSSFNVGTISGFGINVQGGITLTVDEIRLGTTYGDVVGYIPPPSAPTGLTATPGVNSVGLSWGAVSGATGYKVLRGTASGVYTSTNNVTSPTNYDVTVVGGTTYYYVVQATNSTGPSAYSSEVSATPTIALPSAPTGVTATGNNGFVTLNWTAGAGAAGYNVKRSTTTGTETLLTNIATVGFVDSNVVNGTQYFYTVSSTNSAGESADSSEVNATPNTPPAAPTGVSATAGTNQVTLNWTASSGATSYNVKRSTTSGSGYTTISTSGAVTGTSYTDTTAIKFTHYYYVVSAVNSYGESGNSSPEADATPTGIYAPTVYEPFNYTAGTLANNTASTGTGFTGNWSVSAFPTITTNNLTYPNLPTANNAYLHQAAGAQTTVDFASPLSSGTKYISFLMRGPGNSGGDAVGVFFKGSNATSLFAGFRTPNAADTTGFGLGTVNSSGLTGATGLGSAVNINNTNVHFFVIKIDFNTSGTNDTVSLWVDPAAGTNAPGASANVTVTTFDVGTISSFGINITGGYTPIIDELRIGDLYGDVTGYNPKTTSTTALTTSQSPAAPGADVTFTATVSGSAGTATGTVQFRTNGVVFGSATLSGGVATLTTNAVNAHGTNSVTAVYNGDFNYYASTGAVAQVVNTAPSAANDTATRNSGYTLKITIASLLSNDSDADLDSLTLDSTSATTTNGATLAHDATYVYVPAGTVDDAFTYTVRDPIGATSTATVTIAINTAPQTGQAQSVTPGVSNATAVFYGIPGTSYTVQRATVVTFDAGLTNFPSVTAPTNGVFQITDDFSDLGSVPGSAFYRLSVP